jgi:hypothetical protein
VVPAQRGAKDDRAEENGAGPAAAQA